MAADMLTNLVRELDDHDLSVLHTRNTQNGLVGVACVNPLHKNFSRPGGPPHPSPSPCVLAGGSQSRVSPRCATRCDRASPRWRPSDILPQDGHMREEGWETKVDRGHAVAQCQRHSGNTPHWIPVPPGQIGTCRHEENSLWCREWLLQRRSTSGWPTPDHFHHTVGAIPLSRRASRLCCFWWRLFAALRRNCLRRPGQN